MLVLKSKKKVLEGLSIQRVLPQAEKRMVGPFIFLDHMRSEPENEMLQVGPHPHIGLATLTYLFEGKIDHQDSLGNQQTILPGEVNWMEAGSGISHSEISDIRPGQSIHGLQFWVALPDHLEDIAPNFTHFGQKQIPQIRLSDLQIDVIVGKYAYLESPVRTHSETLLVHFISQGTQSFHYRSRDWEVGFYLIEGAMQLNGIRYQENELVVFMPNEKIHIELFADTRVILFGGEAFPKSKQIFWNFVSSSKEKLKKAQVDWNEGRFPTFESPHDRILSPEMKIIKIN